MPNNPTEAPASESENTASDQQPPAEETAGKKQAEGHTEPALEDPQTYDDYQDAMGDLADGDEASSMGGPAI